MVLQTHARQSLVAGTWFVRTLVSITYDLDQVTILSICAVLLRMRWKEGERGGGEEGERGEGEVRGSESVEEPYTCM